MKTLSAAMCAAMAIVASVSTISAETITVASLPARTHIHGLAVDRSDPSYLFIATHHGLYRASPDGSAERVSIVQDFMGFNAHPSEPGVLFASGHPAAGGNLGVIASSDGGRTWTEISPGLNGPVDFHQMSVSPADPKTIYGAFGALQVSHDGGRSWTIAGPLPDRVIDLAGSSKRDFMLYAATQAGLLASHDGGASWRALIDGPPVSMVETTPDGSLYAFVVGRGLVKAEEAVFDFATVSSGWGNRHLLHLAADPSDPGHLYAATGQSEVIESRDGGKTWSYFGRPK